MKVVVTMDGRVHQTQVMYNDYLIASLDIPRFKDGDPHFISCTVTLT